MVTRVFLWQVWDRLPFGTYEMIGESSAAIDEANTDDTGREARGPGAEPPTPAYEDRGRRGACTVFIVWHCASKLLLRHDAVFMKDASCRNTNRRPCDTVCRGALVQAAGGTGKRSVILRVAFDLKRQPFTQSARPGTMRASRV